MNTPLPAWADQENARSQVTIRKYGWSIEYGMELTVGTWPHKVIPEEVTNPGEIVLTANRFYRRPDRYSVAVLQLTYDDENG